jgi:hypothetical protein
MKEKDTKPTSSNILCIHKLNVMKQLFIWIFYLKTGSMTDKNKHEDLRMKYDLLSKRINKFLQWVEDNWNDFPSEPETGNR